MGSFAWLTDLILKAKFDHEDPIDAGATTSQNGVGKPHPRHQSREKTKYLVITFQVTLYKYHSVSLSQLYSACEAIVRRLTWADRQLIAINQFSRRCVVRDETIGNLPGT